jgi:D-3-phosphoglycerate dehydrogenase / 2-oxoglutarate reductase
LKILVTPRSLTKSGHPSLEEFRRAGYEVVFSRPGSFPTEEELLLLLPGCVGYLAGVEPVCARVLDAAKQLRVIGRNGTGVDNIDIDAARRNGIAVCRAEGANARGVAELAFGHILASARAIPSSDHDLKQSKWERSKGFQLERRTLGVIGCGKIGRLVAGFALSFDMEVIAHDLCPENPLPSMHFSFGTFDEVIARADIISLHCPAMDDGSALVNRRTIASMKKGVYLVNTARAGLMEDDAVLEALDTGQIAGVATDVFRAEPPEDWRLARHSRVIATPHIGGFTDEGVDQAVSVAVKNMLDVLAKIH